MLCACVAVLHDTSLAAPACSDTNVTDHNTWVFRKEGLKFEIAVDGPDLA